MTSATAALVYLVVSVETALVQGLALWWMRQGKVQRGAVRTIACRVLVAVVYVYIGVTTLFDQRPQSLADNLIVFAAVQLVWQANSIADLVNRRSDREDPPADRTSLP